MNEHTRWELRSTLMPDVILAAITAFTVDRPRIWKETSHPQVYQVHEVGPEWADVTEGDPFAWSREHYDWSQPGIVTLRQLDSNVADPSGGHIEYRVTADGPGSVIRCERRRAFRSTWTGLIAGSYMRLFGPWICAVSSMPL